MLAEGEVEMVARNFTINCDRWQQIAFSGVYYLAGQRVLVPLNSPARSIATLPEGARVCAPRASTSLAKLEDYPSLEPVPAATHTACLVLLQQGQADAITGDDTVLAGLVAQDPYTKVVGPKFTDEPYGLGINAEAVDFVRFVNAALDEYRTSGAWQASYDRWLAPSLGAAGPPTPVYGRRGPTG
jgi:polar amino acid transport system substrate-binding protein